MKKLLSVVAFLLCFAGSLYAEGYLYPTGPNGGPPQSCPGCPAPRTSENSTTLDKVWPYSDPIIGFHRFLDSLWIKDWQAPLRTVRAFKATVAPSRNRIYMRIGGGMLAAYDLSRFPGRLAAREELVAGARRTTLTGQFEGYDLYLKPDKFFYAENRSTGWTTPITDGQERLITFDYDDRGNVYLAYSHFGWGIVKDNGTNDGNLMQTVKQMYGDVTNNIAPNVIFNLKMNNGRYYAFVAEQIHPNMQIWDVTTPENPIRQGSTDFMVLRFAKSATHLAVVRNFTVEVYTNEGFLARQPPIYTASRGNDLYWTVTSDGTNFYAAKQMSNGRLGITTLTVNGNSVSASEFTGERLSPNQIEYHDGYLTVNGATDLGTDVHLFKVTGGSPEQIDLNQWVTKYYSAPPAGYVRPPIDQTTFYNATPLKVDNKVYVILSVYGLGDVIEVKSADGITASRIGAHASGDVFYGDTVDFVASTAVGAPAKSVTWDFGNPESGTNIGTSTTPQTVSHTYSGITSNVPVTRTVWARATGAEASVSVTLKPPTARFRVLGPTGLTFTEPNPNSTAPIVVGDVFGDISDGDPTGHLTTWSIDTVSEVKPAGSSQDVGTCGTHTLSFTANYGAVTGNAVTGAYPVTISPFTYTVRPFAAAISAPVSLGNSLQFTGNVRPSSAHPSASLTNQWDLVGANDQVLFAGPTGTPTWAIDKVNIQPNSRIRLKVTSSTAPTGACASMTESIAYSDVLNPPDPVIGGGCATAAGDPPCTFTATSQAGSNVTVWTNEWSVSGGPATPSSGTGTTFTPTFTATATYTVSLKSTNAIGSVTVSKQVPAKASSLCPAMVDGVNIFIKWNGATCSQNGGVCTPGESLTFDVGTFLNYNLGCATHTYQWNIAGMQSSNKVVSTSLPSGSHNVSVTVSNGAETKTLNATVNVGQVVQPPPPPPPPPTPNPGSCGTMNNTNVFVSFANVGGTCNENNPNCPANQAITFTASASPFAGYSFACANHSFNWTIDGQPKSGQSTEHTFTSSGPKVVSLTISNGSQQFTTGATINVSGGTGPTPPTPPPPQPPTGGCGTMTSSNVFITFSTLGGTCNENNPTNCPANQEIVFVAGASAFGTGGYSFACANHSFTWTIDGQQKSGQSVGHTFTSQGQKTVNLTISNGTQTFPVSATLVVGAGGIPVTPDFTVTIAKSLLVPGTSIYRFEPVIDPASAKTSIHTYAWNFGDGKPVLEVRTSDAVFHEYIPACPTCNVTLTVYDSLNRPLATTTEPLVPPAPSRRRGVGH